MGRHNAPEPGRLNDLGIGCSTTLVMKMATWGTTRDSGGGTASRSGSGSSGGHTVDVADMAGGVDHFVSYHARLYSGHATMS